MNFNFRPFVVEFVISIRRRRLPKHWLGTLTATSTLLSCLTLATTCAMIPPPTETPPDPAKPGTNASLARCHVVRAECLGDTVTSSGVFQCAGYSGGETPEEEFDGHVCYDARGKVDPDAAEQACYNKFCIGLSKYNFDCQITAVTVESGLPGTALFPKEACANIGGTDDGRREQVTCQIDGKRCMQGTVNGFSVCTSYDLGSQTVDKLCFDPITTSGLQACEDTNSDLDNARPLLISVGTDNAACPAPSGLITDATYSLTPSPVASASFKGQTMAVTQRGGFARVRQDCYGSSCSASSLASLRILTNVFTVAGVQIRNVELRTNHPAKITGGTINTGDLALDLTGNIGTSSVISSLRIVNSGPMTVTASETTFNLTGSASFVVKDVDGSAVTTSVTFSSSGSATTAMTCDTATPKQVRFGFEDATKWTSSQATLTTVTSPKTEGCFAMGVAGSGYMTMQSSVFPASDAGAGSNNLKVDLFIPTSQPNQYWLGALQAFVECPSAGLFNAYVGNVDLTGRPVGKFSTLTFPLPQNVRATLAGNSSDCLLRLGLNVNQTGQNWILDNLRFTN